MRRYSFVVEPNAIITLLGSPRVVLVHLFSCPKSIFSDISMESLKISTTLPSAKTEGYVLSPINESPTSIEVHDTVTDDQPIDPPAAEGHRGTFARFFLLLLEPLLKCSPAPQFTTIGGHSSREDDAALSARSVCCTSVVYPYLNVPGSSQMHSMRASRS